MYKLFFKRVIDILVSLIGLPVFCLAFIVLAPIIALTDKGPVFYTADRLGMKGRIFKMYKFRSMRVNSPDLRNSDGSTYNGDGDPRVTKIGRIMRKTSLDELPQLLNVLKGDMSLIGPRPHLVTSYKGYESLTPEKKKRLEVRPGITGYSQAYFRNSIDSNKKIENDCYYADHVSFAFDARIFFHTIKTVLLRKNVYVSETAPASVRENDK
ncbi:MAG: sugar transferase [Clostridiales bacterium]|nr:sugar transferase [Clostridiales bacterium]